MIIKSFRTLREALLAQQEETRKTVEELNAMPSKIARIKATPNPAVEHWRGVAGREARTG